MTVNTQLSRSDRIKWGITIGLTLIMFLIPETGFYSGEIKRFFVITVACLALMAFEFFPLLIVAGLMPMLWALFNVVPASVAMGPWMGSTMYMIVGMFVMTASLEHCGLLKRIAFILMSKINGSYPTLLIGIMVVGFILGVLTLGAAYAIVAALCAGLCYSLNVQRTKAGAGIAMAGMMGACSSHAYTYSAQAIAVIFGVSGDLLEGSVITPISVFLHNWPMFFVCLGIMLVVIKWYKPEEAFNSGDYFKRELEAMGSISHREKVNAFMIACVLVYICSYNIHHLDLNYAFALVPYIVFLPFLNGADGETLKFVNWQMIFFVAGCMAIGTVATALGIGNILAEFCMGAFTSLDNVFAIFGAVFAMVFGLNFLMTPMAIWSLLAQPILQAAVALGYNPVPFVYALISCSEAIILPYEYVPYLLFYGFGIIKMGDFVKLNMMRSVLFFGGYLIILIPYWYLVGLF